jgi:hypothetical protein
MSTVTVSSIESFVAAVEAAEQRLAAGEAQARRAKALLLQAEKARDEAAARKAEAEQELAPIEEALRKARALRALVGEEVISQGEALLEQTWEEAQVEVSRLQAEAGAAQAEVERLMAAPEVRAYLDYRQAQEHAEQEARAEEREELEARLAALRPGAAVGQGTAALADLAIEAKKAGFPDLATQAREAAEAAQQVTEAQAQAERALRKRQLTRWAERRAGEAQAGDFVFVVNRDGEARDEQRAATHLRPLPAQSGRLRFQVVVSLGVENPPDEYSDVPSRGRAWRWRNPPVGEVEGLNEAQAEVVAGIVKGKLRSGWSINRANARLARKMAQERKCEASQGSQATVGAEVVTEIADETLTTEAPTQPIQHESAGREQLGAEHSEVETRPPEVAVTDGLADLPPQVAARLQRVGLSTRRAVEDMFAAGDGVFLALPGIGPEALEAVKAWLNPPPQADHTEAEVERQPTAAPCTDEEPYDAERGEAVAAVAAQIELIPAIADCSAERASGEPQPNPSRRSLAAFAVSSDAPLVASAVCEDARPAYQPQPQIPEPAITVEGDGVDGQRLAQWRGVARVGLTPVARRLGLDEIQMLVHEDGEASTLVAYWPGGETTLSCSSDGRAGQMRAVRELARQIQAAA